MNDHKRAFAVYSYENNVLRESSSGGAFYELGSYYLEKLNGVVYGVSFSRKDFSYTRVDKIENLGCLLKSKYIKANINGSFRECLLDLRAGRYVLFVGIPCQVASLLYYLKSKDTELSKLLTIDLICHGAPNSKYWDMYVQEKFKGKRILNVDFRYKKPSWEKYSIKIETNKGTYLARPCKDEYMRAFLNNYLFDESCYNCKFKGENRFSDITLGDFWGVKNIESSAYSKNGTSLLVTNYNNDEILNILSNKCFVKEVDYFGAFKNNSSYLLSANKPSDLDYFHALLSNGNSFCNSVNKIVPHQSFLKRVLRKFKKIFKHTT